MKRKSVLALCLLAAGLAVSPVMAEEPVVDVPGVEVVEIEESDFNPDIDIEAAEEFMQMAAQAENDKRYVYARSYYQEAFRLNPYNDTPLVMLEELNNRTGHRRDNKQVFLDGMDVLMERAHTEGIHSITVSAMEQLLMGVLRADENDVEARYQLLWLCNSAGLPEFSDLARALMDDLIYLADNKRHYDIFAYAVVSKMFALDNSEDMRRLLEPNARKLAHSENGVSGLVVLSLIYEKKRKEEKAARYLAMARSADSTGQAVDYWLSAFRPKPAPAAE